MIQTQRSVIFDMDGTLIDPLVGIANSYRHMCRSLGIPESPDDEIRGLIGPPLHDAMAAHFGFKGDMINEAVQLYRDYYAPHGVHEYTKYPGIDDLLTNLRHSGLTLHIATSKPAKFADQIIDETGWRTLFSTVGGASLDGSRRHKKDVITWVLGQLPASNHTLVYVGDRPEDAIAAQATGLQFIGVNWGFSSTADLLSAGAKRIATSAELVAQMIFDTDFA